MAKRGGFGGMGMMPGNMNNLMKQAQRMQKQMEETKAALEEDIEMLEDLVLAAINEVLRLQSEDEQAEMGKITGGGGLPF